MPMNIFMCLTLRAFNYETGGVIDVCSAQRRVAEDVMLPFTLDEDATCGKDFHVFIQANECVSFMWWDNMIRLVSYRNR